MRQGPVVAQVKPQIHAPLEDLLGPATSGTGSTDSTDSTGYYIQALQDIAGTVQHAAVTANAHATENTTRRVGTIIVMDHHDIYGSSWLWWSGYVWVRLIGKAPAKLPYSYNTTL